MNAQKIHGRMFSGLQDLDNELKKKKKKSCLKPSGTQPVCEWGKNSAESHISVHAT